MKYEGVLKPTKKATSFIVAAGIPATWDIYQNIVITGGQIVNAEVQSKKVDFEMQNLWIKNPTIITGLVRVWSIPCWITSRCSVILSR